MKISGIFNAIVAMAVSVATISCEKGNDVPVIDSTISVEGSKLVTKSSAAADFEIVYSVSGVHAGEAVKPSADKEWVSFGESDPGIVSVSIAENLTSSDRTAMITLSLEGANDIFLTIVQSANPDYKVDRTLTFDLDVSEITSSVCRITVNPNKQTSYFYYGIVTKEHYDSFGSDEDFIAAYVEEIVEKAQAEGNDDWSIESFLSKGYVSHDVSGLTPDTDFYLVAFDLSLGAEYSGVLARHKFKTRPMTPSSLEFEITVDEKTAIVTVKPKDSFDGKYVLEVVPLSMWNRYGDPRLAAEDFIEWVNDSGDYNITQFLHEGEFSAAYYVPGADMGSITTGDYVAFAFGCDGAKVTSGVSYTQFHFEEPKR